MDNPNTNAVKKLKKEMKQVIRVFQFAKVLNIVHRSPKNGTLILALVLDSCLTLDRYVTDCEKRNAVVVESKLYQAVTQLYAKGISVHNKLSVTCKKDGKLGRFEDATISSYISELKCFCKEYC